MCVHACTRVSESQWYQGTRRDREMCVGVCVRVFVSRGAPRLQLFSRDTVAEGETAVAGGAGLGAAAGDTRLVEGMRGTRALEWDKAVSVERSGDIF